MYIYLPWLVIKFISLSEFVSYRAIKVTPSNYFNTLRGPSLTDFNGPSDLQFGQFGPSCLLRIGTTGRVVLGRLFYGPSCPGLTCLWAELS